MPVILICSGLAAPLEQQVDCAIDFIAGEEEHYKYFSHPLRNIPLPLLPSLDDSTQCASLLQHDCASFVSSSGFNVLHTKTLLDEWVSAARQHVGAGSTTKGQVLLVVDALRFKTYERWATSRGFPIDDIISNGRTTQSSSNAETPAGPAVLDVSLAMQHLRRHGHVSSLAPASDGNGGYTVGFVGIRPILFTNSESTPETRTEKVLSMMNSVRLQSTVDNGQQSVVAALSTASAPEGKMFYIPAPQMDRLEAAVEAVDGAVEQFTLLEAVRHHVGAEQLTQMYLHGFNSFDLDFEEYAQTSLVLAAIPEWTASLLRHVRENCSRPVVRKSAVVTRSYARVGVMGNPSDQLHGMSMALSIDNFWTNVFLFPHSACSIRILPNPVTDPNEFGGLDDLHALSSTDGYSGGMRLIQAICKRFYQYVDNKRDVLFPDMPDAVSWSRRRGGFTIAYETNVPRQVGLAGSSCIVTATLKALLNFYGLDDSPHVPKEILPTIALSAEMEELGIHAGLMDRVVQMYGGFVMMDFRDAAAMRHHGHAVYTQLDPKSLPQLHLAYAIDPSDSGKMHSTVKQRWLNGDEEVIASAKRWATLVELLHESIVAGTAAAALGNLMDQNFDLRRQLYGDACLGRKNLRMVDIARSHGANAKFPGSGGAILIYCNPATVNVWQLRKAMYAEGFVLIPLGVRH